MKEFMVPVVLTFFCLSIFFYVFANLIYTVLLILAFRDLRKNHLQSPLMIKLLQSMPPAFAPGISLLAPAYNEGKSIIASVKSFLTLNYPNFEIIIINDGSKDDSLERLRAHFKLQEEHVVQDHRLQHQSIKAVYRSVTHPHLVVIDKENGGKADALNAGLSVSKFPLFCAVDSDCVLEEDALLRIALPFFEDPERTLATGGNIRVLNGSTVKNGRVVRPKLQFQPLVLFQNVEYIRSFLCGRVGWNALNSTLIISGAFGLFQKEAVIEVGAYDHKSIGEDMELVVRLHRHFTERVKRDYRISYVPDPVCWTEVPFDLGTLSRQRSRWQRGLADTLKANPGLFHHRYGALGLLAMPYFYLVELWGPVIEILSWSFVILGFCLGLLNKDLLWLFFFVGLVYGMFMTLMAVLLEELYYRKGSSVREFLLLFLFGFLETFGYRQLTSYWRLKGLWNHIKGRKHIWGEMKRKGIN